MALSAVTLVYFSIATALGSSIRIYTMRWPQDPEHILVLVQIVVLFAFIFGMASLSTTHLLAYVKLGLSSQASLIKIKDPSKSSLKKIKILFYLTTIGGLVLLALTVEGWWLFTPYPESKKIWRVIDIGGLGFVANLFCLLGFNLGWRLGRPYRGFAVVLLILLALQFVLSGDRGSLIFWVLGCLIVVFMQANKAQRSWLYAWMVVGVIPLMLLLNNISAWRSWSQDANEVGFASYVEEIDLLPQSFAHLLYAYDISNMYGAQFNDNMLGFFGTMLIQLFPNALLNMFGFETYNGAIRLKEYVFHGGGFFVPGEMYFVGGYTGVILISIYFGVVSAFNDRIISQAMHYRMSQNLNNPVMISACLAIGSLPYTFFYGLQAINRMSTLPILVMLIIIIYRYLLQGIGRRVSS